MSSRRTNRVQRKVRVPSSSKKKSDKKKTEKVGEIPCGINGCDGYADKHMGGRSLSQENGIETGVKVLLLLERTECESAKLVTEFGRKTTKMTKIRSINLLHFHFYFYCPRKASVP